MGALRSSAQLIAYDIAMGFVILTLVLTTKSLNVVDIINFQSQSGYFLFYYPVLFIIFFVCALAETNRHPFDLPEAEAELVSGYNVEYSSIGFACFFLAEYSSILFMIYLTIILFFGGFTCDSDSAIFPPDSPIVRIDYHKLLFEPKFGYKSGDFYERCLYRIFDHPREEIENLPVKYYRLHKKIDEIVLIPFGNWVPFESIREFVLVDFRYFYFNFNLLRIL